MTNNRKTNATDNGFQDAWNRYKTAVEDILRAFLHKQEMDDADTYWIGDEVGGSVSVNDEYVFSMDDLILDLNEDAPVDEIFNWWAYSMDCTNLGLRDLNYRSWLHGAPRHSKEDVERLYKMNGKIEELKREFRREVIKCNGEEGF